MAPLLPIHVPANNLKHILKLIVQKIYEINKNQVLGKIYSRKHYLCCSLRIKNEGIFVFLVL